jgi:hypothetical protein
MTSNLSGLKVEYAIALLYSAEAGKRSLESLAHPLLRRMSVALHNLDQKP